MIRKWTNAGASTEWYNATNWTPATNAAAWLPTDVAEFKNAGSAVSAKIDMSAGNLTLGAISLTERTRNLTISNSSAAAGTGHLQLNGATVNGIDNVILSTTANIPPYTLFIKGMLKGLLSRMDIVLGNSNENVILLNGEAGSAMDISAAITGTDKKLTLKTASSSGGILTLSGANTYTGLTKVQARHGSIVLARSGGGTLPANNSVEIADGTLRIKTNQTLRNVKVSQLGRLVIDPGVILTLTGILEAGTILFPGGGVTGTIEFV